MEWYTIALIAVLLIGLTAGIALYTYRKNNPKGAKSKGADVGGAQAVNVARRWARSNDFRVVAPVRLSGKGKFASLDALVIGYFGILGVKAYGYNGEIYGAVNEAQWLQVAGDGTRTYFPNPMDEASADVRVIRDALLKANIKGNIPIDVVCVFTDKKVQLALPKSTGHYTVKTFKDLLDKEKYRADVGLDLDKAQAAIEAASVKE